ncbi:MAG: phenylalanine--tRNA ligase subunit alpha [Patescibacteria group bacterium]|nr:phenylalanine--tRNA ligase subunit alpha [Patescibacteria group bacterium]
MDDLEKEAYADIESAENPEELKKLRIKYVGRKSDLTRNLRGLKDLTLEEKRTLAPKLQKIKRSIEELLDSKEREFSSIKEAAKADLTRPGIRHRTGHLHPLTIMERKVVDIFSSMNFSVVDGPEVETEHYNFDALNIPANHPAREMWDTFWLKPSATSEIIAKNLQISEGAKERPGERLLLRTHTSPMQVRYLETHTPPLQIIVPGRVFRYEATDASHEANFYQVEGLMVGKDVSLANFKYVIGEFLKKMFGSETEFRFRPSYFPFTEPSLEVDIRLVGGKSKSNANLKAIAESRKSDWLEVMGAGMVNQKVFEAAHYNPGEWRGFAFGVGLERLAMLKYKIPDIRLFYGDDLRFIDQF